jgi:hypothetical protein
VARLPRSAHRGFTLLEVALIVAIIAMMLMIIIGWILAPEKKGPLPPIPEASPLISTPAPATPAPATPAKTIELKPPAAAPAR